MKSGGVATSDTPLYNLWMPYKESWGTQARARALKRSEYFREYNRSRGHKKNARTQVELAIKRKDLTPLPCEFLSHECKGRIEAHHDDHLKPLEVRWVCNYHHRKIESELHPELNCLECGISIPYPKKKFCSSRCNLKHWRKSKAS